MCCFRKALYSLKQSPRAWLAKSDVVLGKILLSMWMIYYYGGIATSVLYQGIEQVALFLGY